MGEEVTLESLTATIKGEPTVWARLAASKEADRWQIRLLEITTGAGPPNWQEQRWEYPSAVFIALAEKGPTVARWLETREISTDPIDIPLEGLGDNAYRDRKQSGWSPGLYEPLEWPWEELRLNYRSDLARQPPDDLVADGAPSFVTFAVAAACLLSVEPEHNRSFSGPEIVVRRQDLTGRLAQVHVKSTEIEARVEGRGLNGMVLELAGNEPGPLRRLEGNEPCNVNFPLTSGIPAGGWILLRTDDHWIDRRFLDWPYTSPRQAGVEFIVEPSTRLEVLVAEGEGPGTEFKSWVPSDDDSIRNIMKTVAAFANGDGGSILFGVSDEGEPVGLSTAETGPEARDRISNLIRSWVSPLVSFGYESLPTAESGDRQVLVLTVERGDGPPYGAGSDPENLRYYARRGATSFPISAHEVRKLARSRPPMEGPVRYPQTPGSL